jgi:rubrerythrin
MRYTRRDFITSLCASGLLCAGPGALSFAARAQAYAATVAALRQGVRGERRAYTRYRVFGSDAAGEGYRGIAYMFGAISLSELIHAQNYNRVLATLGQPREEPADEPPEVGTTKENVIAAMEAEIVTIDRIYPGILEGVQKDALADAVRNVQYAWASHVQHRDTLEKIRRYTPDYFETVARRIDENSERYYVCQICGSVQDALPEEQCPICEQPPASYSFVDPETLIPPA